MSSIKARIRLNGSAIDCDKAFCDLRNEFRGLFSCGTVIGNRTGKEYSDSGSTEYVFTVECEHKDAPVVKEILISLGFVTIYL